jgi:FtsH-binding integral membrane protein
MSPSFSSPSIVSSRPLTKSGVSQVYLLLTLALLVTLVGLALGSTVLVQFVTGPAMLLLFIVELGLIFTSGMWSRSAPLNYILFLAFPLISGLTLAPLLLVYVAVYTNGVAIITNALIATTLLTASAAVLSSIVRIDIWGTFGMFLMQALIGLIVFSLLQMFFPSLRGTGAETVVSGIGVVVFSLFLTADFQRLTRGGISNPFLLALSLYLDIFNLFVYVLRFMGALSGRDN